jgi:feruloyl esterase
MPAFTSRFIFWSLLACGMTAGTAHAADGEAARCAALRDLDNLTITSARLVEASGETPAYCHVVGSIGGSVRYHMQLPFKSNWNGRFLNWGDGGKDGDLDFADARLAEGYAVANSNMGHDNGAEPGASFGFNDRQAEIDFGYRAVHLTVTAAKTLIRAYYGEPPRFSYHEGCSTGGREGLMEAQRYPQDFDGIVAGAPVAYYQEVSGMLIWVSQKLFADNFAGNLAFDADGDGIQESLGKLNLLASRVMDICDGVDGIHDGVIDDPRKCDFRPERDLKAQMCPRDENADKCFTRRQLANIEAIYEGPKDKRGRVIYKGMPLSSELAWLFVPHAGNGMQPFFPARDHINYLFYEEDPGVAPADMGDITQKLRKEGPFPEWAWWEFDIADLANRSADFMRRITNATDPDMRRFLIDHKGKLLLYHGWADANAAPQPILDYYEQVVTTTFGGDLEAATDHARLFMVPGMNHCRGGPGPDEWDRLAPMIDWVEKGKAPDRIIARHRTNGTVDNERPICVYPGAAHYTGPEGGADEPRNWVAKNFTCH